MLIFVNDGFKEDLAGFPSVGANLHVDIALIFLYKRAVIVLSPDFQFSDYYIGPIEDLAQRQKPLGHFCFVNIEYLLLSKTCVAKHGTSDPTVKPDRRLVS